MKKRFSYEKKKTRTFSLFSFFPLTALGREKKITKRTFFPQALTIQSPDTERRRRIKAYTTHFSFFFFTRNS